MSDKPKIGHNSDDDEDSLQSLVAEIEARQAVIDDEKAAIKVMYERAKNAGIDVKVLRLTVKRRAETAEAREQREKVEAAAEDMLELLTHYD